MPLGRWEWRRRPQIGHSLITTWLRVHRRLPRRVTLGREHAVAAHLSGAVIAGWHSWHSQSGPSLLWDAQICVVSVLTPYTGLADVAPRWPRASGLLSRQAGGVSESMRTVARCLTDTLRFPVKNRPTPVPQYISVHELDVRASTSEITRRVEGDIPQSK